MKLILASASPRRRELLERLGLAFEVAPADVDETPRPGEAPDRYAARVAGDKARVARARVADAWILAADTTVVLDGDVLGKPDDAAHAARMLAALAGRAHQVMTAVCLERPDGRAARRVVVTDVIMRPLSAVEIARHTAAEEWRGKAGGYAAQGLAAAFITEIHGSYTNVVGLPLAEVALDLAELSRDAG
jgi:septum formation protein